MLRCLAPVLLAGAALAPAHGRQLADPAIARVEVKGPDPLQQRRDDALGRVVIGRAELLRYGDGALSAALQRQGGVAVVGGQIRLRGLGAGYTQILIDGEPAPAGFAVDNLSPELVERVEINRSAQADLSAQAVAGSINIILRKNGGARRRSLRLGVQPGGSAQADSAVLQASSTAAAATYAISATADHSRRREHPQIDERSSDGSAVAVRHFDERDDNRSRKLSLVPRIDFKLGGGDSLAWHSLIDLSRIDARARQRETTLQGAPTASPDASWRALYDSWLVKSDLAWAQRLAHGRLTLKAGIEANQRRGDYRFDGIDASGTPWLRRAVDSDAGERRAASSGKYLSAVSERHALAFGWDGALTRRNERRLQRDSVTADAPPWFVLDQDYVATVSRLALYAQDEWALDARLQAYLGLRWEALRTRIGGGDGAARTDAASSSGVASPIMQLVWKLPGSGRDQLRLALARTYKAPQPRELLPRRYTVNNDNGPASPDYQGNPLLRPELSWGLDAAYEAYFASGAMVSLALYQRRIDDVVQLRLWQDHGSWVSMPANGGGASAHGIALEGRLPIKAASLLSDPGTAFELRADAARNWSKVEALPGPDNRLADQVPLSLTLGIDARRHNQLSAGANFQLTGGWRNRSAASLLNDTATLRMLEAYLSWPGQGGQWRLSAANLLGAGRRSRSAYDDGLSAVLRTQTTPAPPTLRLQFDLPL